jgi:hypothetical protein
VADDGSVRDHFAQSLRFEPARADPHGRAQGLSLSAALDVPPGRYTIRLMLREGASGKSSVRFLDVGVPPYDRRSVFALPPLVLEDTGRWLTLELGSSRGTSPQAEAPFQPTRIPATRALR